MKTFEQLKANALKSEYHQRAYRKARLLLPGNRKLIESIDERLIFEGFRTNLFPTKGEAEIGAPWAKVITPVEEGWLAFESEQEYEVWKLEE